MEYQIGRYVFKTTEKDNRIFWANDHFWSDWPKLAELRLVYADSSKASPSNFGHVDIRVNLQEVQEHCVIRDNSETDPNYWDCECKERYINPKTLIHCPRCQAYRDDSPDSRVIEINDLTRNYF